MIGMGFLYSFVSHAFVEVGKHKMQCNSAFPCPPDLQDRVNFWIDIYGRWDSQDSVLHDALVPHRVYAVFEGRACGRKGNTSFVKEQKKRISGELHTLAKQLDRNSTINSGYRRHLLKLFPDRSSAEIRRAASDIRCQTGNRDGFQAALRRFGTYGPIVRNVLKSSGLPRDIQYLPFVESSYNPKAYSRVGAAGMWQIMPATARDLGLELNATVDERLDPEAASWAAARYLKKARATLTKAARKKDPQVKDSELSPFVITSYNYGMNGMRRAITKIGPDYMQVLNKYRSGSFQVAVKNFYAGFLAARHVAKNQKKFFGSVMPGRPLRYDTLVLDRPVSISRIKNVFNLSEAQLKEFNPALTRFVWHGWRTIPDGYRLRLPPRVSGWQNAVARLKMMPPEALPSGSVEYTVRAGDTACGVAAAFNADCDVLIAMNGLNRQAVIQVGQKLQVPSLAQRRQNVARGGKYIVTSGDTACSIARRYGVGCDDLLAANGLGRGSVLGVGMTLIIPGSLGQSPSAGYTVGKGDSVCSIASRHSVDCDKLLAANGLTKGEYIFPGQSLTIPGVSQTSTENALLQSSNQSSRVTVDYTVMTGDSACRIAARFSVSCRRLITDNQLGADALITPGQLLQIEGVDPKIAKAASQLIKANKEETKVSNQDILKVSTQAWPDINPLDTPVDLSIQISGQDGRTVYRINVEPEETLGHYSDWLRLGGVQKILDLNGYDRSNELSIADALLLPVENQDQKLGFESRRAEYHRVLVEEFKENFETTGTEVYQIEAGDSLWALAREYELPIWVITRYNPALRSGPPRVGDSIRIPQIQSRRI